MVNKATCARAETGPIQFGPTDWPGVFIRGDEAYGYLAAIEHILARVEVKDVWTGTQVTVLDELQELLARADQTDPSPKIVLKPWAECLVYPEYARLGEVALRWCYPAPGATNAIYWRDRGQWGVRASFDGTKLIVVSDEPVWAGQELIAITKEEYEANDR